MNAPVAHKPAVTLIESWLRFGVIETTVPLVVHALATDEILAGQRYRISIKDSPFARADSMVGRSCASLA